jgi:Mce-associated membrane protein
MNREANVSASEERGLRLVPGGADGESAERLAPRSVRRRVARRRRSITEVLSQLDQEPAVLNGADDKHDNVDNADRTDDERQDVDGAGDEAGEEAVDEHQNVPHDEGDAGKRPRRRTAPHRRGPARSVRCREPKRKSRPKISVGTALLVLAVCAAVVVAGVLGSRWYDGRALDRAHQQALAAAKQTTVDFVSVSAASVDRDLQRIVAGATGDFRDEFTRGQAQVRAAVVENNVDSKGSVLRAALVSGDRDAAVVLVAVDATVSNAKSPEGRASHYRIQVDMARDRGSGHWLVAKLQFVG